MYSEEICTSGTKCPVRRALEDQKQALDEHTIVSITDTGGKIVYANDKFCNITQYKHEELIGADQKILDSGYHPNEFFQKMWQEISSGKIWKGEICNLAKDGHRFWVQTTIIPLRDESDRIIQYLSVNTEITELKEMVERVRLERDKLHRILSKILDGVIIVNRSGFVEFASDIALAKIHRIAVGIPINEMLPLDLASDDYKTLCSAIEKGESLRLEVGHGGEETLEISVSPYEDFGGEMKSILILRDITQRKNIEAEALRAGHLASIGELAAGVAHEINNPINGIINYAQILFDEAGSRGRSSEIPERIIMEGDRITRIVGNLLDFARVRHENYCQVSLNTIVSDALALTERQIKKDGITLSVNIAEDIPDIYGNSQKLQQVLLNLLSNARYTLNEKYNGYHEEKLLEIDLTRLTKQDEGWVRMCVYDRGKGIKKHLLNRICEPFFSTKPRGEGTGLGLSITHGIVKEHQGELVITSNLGEFTRICVDLPINGQGGEHGKNIGGRR